MKTQQTKHEESGCTDYLQHNWGSCPENKPYTREECETLANMVKAQPDTARHSPPWLSSDLGFVMDFPGHVIAKCDNYEDRKLIVRAVNNVDKLAEALRAMVDCPDYRGINTHEARKAKQALEDYERSA